MPAVGQQGKRESIIVYRLAIPPPINPKLHRETRGILREEIGVQGDSSAKRKTGYLCKCKRDTRLCLLRKNPETRSYFGLWKHWSKTMAGQTTILLERKQLHVLTRSAKSTLQRVLKAHSNRTKKSNDRESNTRCTDSCQLAGEHKACHMWHAFTTHALLSWASRCFWATVRPVWLIRGIQEFIIPEWVSNWLLEMHGQQQWANHSHVASLM